MEQTFKTIVKIFGVIFAALIIAYSSVLTYMVAGRLVPDNLVLQLATVLLFDGGALVWFFLFSNHAQSTPQWAFAGLGFAVDLIGAVIMAAGELILSQNLVVFQDMSRLGWILIGTVVVSLVTNVVLTYLFHLTESGLLNAIENQQEIAEIVRTAHRDARAQMKTQRAQLASGLTRSQLDAAKLQLDQATAYHIRSNNRTEGKTAEILRDAPVIPGMSRDVPYRPAMATQAQARPQGNNAARPHQQQPGKKHQRPQSRPEPFNGNGRNHNVTAATATVTTTPVIEEAAPEAASFAPPSRPGSRHEP